MRPKQKDQELEFPWLRVGIVFLHLVVCCIPGAAGMLLVRWFDFEPNSPVRFLVGSLVLVTPMCLVNSRFPFREIEPGWFRWLVGITFGMFSLLLMVHYLIWGDMIFDWDIIE